ncbi:hypothetical protein BSF42_02090 [Flavobacterium sp. ACN6]|nr:hypothetical protein BSF42_02090 [Flavobacterium sp. ACN6]
MNEILENFEDISENFSGETLNEELQKSEDDKSWQSYFFFRV